MIKGGAIFWDEMKPIIDEKTVYSGNHALLYGDNIAAIAQ